MIFLIHKPAVLLLRHCFVVYEKIELKYGNFKNCHILNYKDNTIYFDFQILVGKSMKKCYKTSSKKRAHISLKTCAHSILSVRTLCLERAHAFVGGYKI